MKNKNINALATRFKATTLMLLNLEMFETDGMEDKMNLIARLFDNGNYKQAKKGLDLLDGLIVEILKL